MNSEVNVPVPAVYTRFVNQKAQHRYADIWTPAKSFVLPEACVSRKYTNVPIVAFYAVVPLLLLCVLLLPLLSAETLGRAQLSAGSSSGWTTFARQD
jgi:hypothetical protein